MSESQMNDSTFSRLFIIMIISMTIMTIIIAVLAKFASSDVNTRLDERYEQESTQSIAERIAPVGTFSAETVAPTIAVAAIPLTGEEAYSSCGACHNNGTLGAPMVGAAAAADWTARLGKGIETVYAHAINGFNNMPAKGGNASLSDDEVKAAVDYMIERSK